MSRKQFASDELTTRPKANVPAELPTELVINDLVVGDGREVKPNATVTVQYLGVSALNGREFDSSWSRGAEPISFGLNQVISGWSQGLIGMKEGGRRELVIPSHLAYGKRGSPPVIGPDETLVFVVDLISIG
jgi:peptidylprolyl isomerase